MSDQERTQPERRVGVTIIREPDDQMALRASIGGRPETGYYLVYRGDPDAVAAMLDDVRREARRPTADGSGDSPQRIQRPDQDKRGRPQG